MSVMKCPKCGMTQMAGPTCKGCGRPLAGGAEAAAPLLRAAAPAPRAERGATDVGPRFQHPTYLVRRKVFKLFGGAFHIYDPSGELAFYSQMKAFKLKEDIRLYTGEDMQTEVLVIQARRAMDISSEYDVVDPSTGQTVGVLKRKGLKSVLKDEWIFMDPNDQPIGLIKEDSLAMALVRRFLTNLFPQKYVGTIGDTVVCSFKQNFNPFVQKITLDFSVDTGGLLDRRLGIAAAVLLSAIEGRQQ